MKKSLFVLEAVTFTKKRRRHKDDYQPFTTDISFTQVSDLDFRQFVHMPVVLPASCCFR